MVELIKHSLIKIYFVRVVCFIAQRQIIIPSKIVSKVCKLLLAFQGLKEVFGFLVDFEIFLLDVFQNRQPFILRILDFLRANMILALCEF